MINLVFALAVSIVLPVEEVPAPAPSPAPSPVEAASPASAPASERKICRTEQATYSRLAAKRICRTAAEWKAVDRGTPDLDTRQRNRR